LPVTLPMLTFWAMKRGTDWIVVIPPSVLAPLGAYVHVPRKGKSVTLSVQGPVTREQQDDHDRKRTAFLTDMGRLLADLHWEGKIGCSDHNICPMDVVVDTPDGTFAACSRCHQAGVYTEVIGNPRPRMTRDKWPALASR
jgi:hypothetical protein